MVSVKGVSMSDDMLLAYLVSSFPGKTEDIATEALCHVFRIRHSDACVEALNDVVQSGVRDVAPIATLKTQVIGADGTIPDLVGFDKADHEDEIGQERVLIEVKFWAPPHRETAQWLHRATADGWSRGPDVPGA